MPRIALLHIFEHRSRTKRGPAAQVKQCPFNRVASLGQEAVPARMVEFNCPGRCQQNDTNVPFVMSNLLNMIHQRLTNADRLIGADAGQLKDAGAISQLVLFVSTLNPNMYLSVLYSYIPLPEKHPRRRSR